MLLWFRAAEDEKSVLMVWRVMFTKMNKHFNHDTPWVLEYRTSENDVGRSFLQLILRWKE